MPLTVNVGISRKASANYQSAGVSINLTAELDTGLLGDPPRLQDEVAKVYLQAGDALERQVRAMAGMGERAMPPELPPARAASGSPAVGLQDPRGHVYTQRRSLSEPPASANSFTQSVPEHPSEAIAVVGGPLRPATESQVRALRAICKRGRLDLDREVHEEFGLDSPDQLDVKQASQLIDILKTRQGQPSSRGRWG
jgi:hypothetical protein